MLVEYRGRNNNILTSTCSYILLYSTVTTYGKYPTSTEKLVWYLHMYAMYSMVYPMCQNNYVSGIDAPIKAILVLQYALWLQPCLGNRVPLETALGK